LEDSDFNRLIQEKEFYEMIYFRTKIRNNNLLIIPFAIYLTVISYTKFFSFYSLKFLIETPTSYEVFFNVVTTTLYNPILIQIITQSFPQIILQIINNLLNMEHKHAFHLKGVINYSTIISILFIFNLFILYFRDKKDFIDADKISENFKNKEEFRSGSESTLNIKSNYELNSKYSNLNDANREYKKNQNTINNHYLK